MPTRPLLALAALGAATSGGVLYGFSSFIMRSLERLPPDNGIAAMQQINRAAPTPSFMIPLFGTTAVGVWLGIHGLRHLDDPNSRWQIAGAVAYTTATLITLGRNVPLNDRLDRVATSSPTAAEMWARYLSDWTFANHARVVGCLLAAGAWTVALTQLSET